MSTLTSFIIFILILLLYVHITSQYKKSEDLEIYEADYTSNTQIQEICNIRQPVLFNIQSIHSEFFEDNLIDMLEESDTDHEAEVKDVRDAQTGDSVHLPPRSAIKLMETDDNARFYSENNYEMTNDVLEDRCKTMDEFLKPKFVLQTKYDTLFGANGAYTPLRYHNNYRYFLCVHTGKITVKMTPWRSRDMLHVENDYEHYEFRSHVDIWNTQEKYINDMTNLKFLEFDVQPGFVLYIPPYWFYSIKFHKSDSGLALANGFVYNSVMNIVANLPQWSMYYLQQYNITNKPAKTLKLNDRPSDDTIGSTADSIMVNEPTQDDHGTIDTNAPLEPSIDFTERANAEIH